MNTQALFRCFIVSLVIAIVTPIFLFDVAAPIGADGAVTPSVVLDPSSPAPFPEMQPLHGIEKYRYILATAWLWPIYLEASAINFLIAFVASLAVSFWNERQPRDA
jgi:hypothetical protein